MGIELIEAPEKIAMKKIVIFSILLFLLATASAIAEDVSYNFANSHWKFKTYKWVIIDDVERVDELKDTEIRRALDRELAKRHLTKTDADTVDLYIGYQAVVDTEKRLAFANTDWGYGPGWYQDGWYRGYYGKTKGQISTLYAGQLAVDMYDAKNHFLVWRGVVSDAIDPIAEPDKQKKKLNEAVHKLLNMYPPPNCCSLPI